MITSCELKVLPLFTWVVESECLSMHFVLDGLFWPEYRQKKLFDTWIFPVSNGKLNQIRHLQRRHIWWQWDHSHALKPAYAQVTAALKFVNIEDIMFDYLHRNPEGLCPLLFIKSRTQGGGKSPLKIKFKTFIIQLKEPPLLLCHFLTHSSTTSTIF